MFRVFQSSTRRIVTVGRSPCTRWMSSASSDNILKVAIVGSGPSGCYTAKYLQSALQKQDRPVKLAVIDRLPTPYGLVRQGVAPDHPEVKNVEHDFAKLFTDNNNSNDNNDNNNSIQLYANVQVGKDVSLQELRQLHDVVVLAYGCESDRKLGIPGEDLKGVLSAREFVAWYNGHVDYAHIGDKVKDALLLLEQDGGDGTGDGGATNIVVIGQGNVALDCARILAKTKDSLLATDIASRALPVILGNTKTATTTTTAPRTIHVVGRRGHVQGAFTIKVGTDRRKNHACLYACIETYMHAGMHTSTKNACIGREDCF